MLSKQPVISASSTCFGLWQILTKLAAIVSQNFPIIRVKILQVLKNGRVMFPVAFKNI